MMYTRASASDYDDWATVHQNADWGSQDLLPLLKKVRPRLTSDIPIPIDI
jgi:alcohol oxidase